MKKAKRFLTALLCTCVFAGIMATVVSAVTILTIINLTVTAPAVGKKPEATTASVPSYAHSVVKKLEWSGNFDSNGAFKAGEKYTATVTMGIKAGEDWKFSDNVTMSVKVNKKAADKIWYINDKELEVVYTFPALAGTSTPTTSPAVLKEAKITLTAPEVGKIPAATATVPSSASYTVKKVEWDGSLSSGKFKENTEYTAYVTLGIKSGKNAVFSDDVFDADVNGYIINEIRWASATEIIVPVEFEKTGTVQSTSKSVISIIRLTVDAPGAGKEPATTASLPSTAHSTVQSVKWSGQLDTDGTFMYCTQYTVTVTLGIQPGANYRFSDKSINGTVNGETADEVRWHSNDKVEVIYTFAALPAAQTPTVLKDAEITLAAPEVGKTPATTATVPSSASYTVKKVEWDGYLSGGKFKADTSYTAYITLSIKSGKNAMFSDVVFDADVNGYIINEIRWVSDTEIIVPVEFEKTPGTTSASTIPASGTAYASTQLVEIDGKKVEFQMYALKDANGNPTNYIKIRDLAFALTGTRAQFNVVWDGAVNLLAGRLYTVAGGENSTPFRGDRAYRAATSATKVNGAASDLTAIVLTDDNSGDYTYYQLRDLGRKLGFNVGWSSEKGVYIETDMPYID